MKYVIIGFSVAAINAIKTLRESDKDGEIEILTEEETVYSRPLISYYLAGKVKRGNIGFIGNSFCRDYKVKAHFLTRVEKIDFKNSLVYTNKNEKINYDRLLISTGGVPIKPAIEGYSGSVKGVFTFTKLTEVDEMIKYIKKNRIKEAVILGGGLIGMKAAEGLLAKKIRLKIVELADRLLANTFDRIASDILEEKLKASGSEFIKETTIRKIKLKSGKIEEILLQNGRLIKTKLLIVAVGVRPNVDIFKGSIVKINRGIIVDKHMQTSIHNVYAAGDVAEAFDFLTDKNSVIAIWPAAARQGKIAGYAMAGGKLSYEGTFAMNSVEILGIPSISFGITNPVGDDYEVLTKEERNRYKKIVLKNSNIVGVILVNDIERAGIYGLIIQEKLNVSEFKNELLKDDFGFLLLPKDFRKHFVTGEGIEV